MNEAAVIEVMLLRWGENHSSGRTVTFQLPDDGEHPFKGIACGPANGQRMALSVALINDDETQRVPKEKRKFDELPLSQQAGILCNTLAFYEYMKSQGEQIISTFASDHAANFIRNKCGIQSRAELDRNQPASMKFKRLKLDYDNWLKE